MAQNGSSRPYPIDNNHSTVGFSVPILGGLSQVKGKFTDFAITINNDEKDITKSSVSVVIKATSVDTGIEGRDRHLRTADFFDVEKFPEITFKSERIEKKGKAVHRARTTNHAWCDETDCAAVHRHRHVQEPDQQQDQRWLFRHDGPEPARLRDQLRATGQSDIRRRQHHGRDRTE